MKKKLFTITLCSVFLFCGTLLAARVECKGKTVVLGDSITASGRYVYYYQLYLAIRKNADHKYLIPAGIAGTSSNVSDQRLVYDVDSEFPEQVMLMFGMNDVGRNLYAREHPFFLKERKKALETYRKNMISLIQRLKKRKIKVVLLAPSPFDSYGAVQKVAKSNIDSGIEMCAKITKELAVDYETGWIDLHSRLCDILKRNPESLLLNDRIHPNKTGHLILASSLISEIAEKPVFALQNIDAEKETVITENAVCGKLDVAPDELKWSYTPEFMPYPVDSVYREADKFADLTNQFNQEILIVRNLKQDRWSLTIDKTRIGKFTKKELENGVNLAVLNTPMQKNAQHLLPLLENLLRADGTVRNLSTAKFRLQEKDGINPENTRAALAYLKKNIDAGKWKEQSYFWHIAKNAAAYLPKERNLRKYANSCRKQLYDAAAEKYTYTLILTVEK